MDVAEHEVEGVTVIVLNGRMDSNTSGGLEPVLYERAKSCDAVVIDLKNVEYVSSAGLRVLLKTAKISRAADKRMALAALRPQVLEVFDISGFTAIFEIFDDVDKARTGIRTGIG
jgi:anti-sigma B factor antagonist